MAKIPPRIFGHLSGKLSQSRWASVMRLRACLRGNRPSGLWEAQKQHPVSVPSFSPDRFPRSFAHAKHRRLGLMRCSLRPGSGRNRVESRTVGIAEHRRLRLCFGPKLLLRSRIHTFGSGDGAHEHGCGCRGRSNPRAAQPRNFFTIDAAFDSLRDSLHYQPTTLITAEFDPQLGYPRRFRFDDLGLFDDDITYGILAFTVVPGTRDFYIWRHRIGNGLRMAASQLPPSGHSC